MVYETRIHIKGEYIVGRYDSEIEAAVAYNKAASTLLKKGYERYLKESEKILKKENTVKYEMNPGGHFADSGKRLAKAVKWR